MMRVTINKSGTSRYDHWYHKYAGKCIEVEPDRPGYRPVENPAYYISEYDCYPTDGLTQNAKGQLAENLDFSKDERPSTEQAIERFKEYVKKAEEIFRDDIGNSILIKAIAFDDNRLEITFTSR